ncbi:MAG: hypothetical protein D6748_13630, partial [Calditrichaeota bacterium]
MQVLESQHPLGKVLPNIATLLVQNVEKFGERIVYKEKEQGEYKGISWNDLFDAVRNIAGNLRNYGFREGEKAVIFSRNRLEMLEFELAVMASGGVAVPIFANFPRHTAELLIRHSDATFLAVSGKQQLDNVNPELPLKAIFVFDDIPDDRFTNLYPFSDLLSPIKQTAMPLKLDAAPGEVCLNMYTSGTMGIPKCVQLTHQNILSQRAALEILWDINETDRFLSYLPWH